MYPVHYLRILTRIIRLRQGDKLFMSEEKPQKQSRQWLFLSKSVPSLQCRDSGTLGGQDGSPYALRRGVTLKNVLEAGDWRRVGTFKSFYYYKASYHICRIIFLI